MIESLHVLQTHVRTNSLVVGQKPHGGILVTCSDGFFRQIVQSGTHGRLINSFDPKCLYDYIH